MRLMSQPSKTATMVRVSHYALLSGLCQFIPVPFLDDAIDLQLRRRMVAGIVKDRREYDVDKLKRLWRGPSRSVAGRAWSIGKGLLLKPVKKLLRTVFFVVTIRRAFIETAEMLLMGHTLDRLMNQDWLQAEENDAELERQSIAIADAVEAAVEAPERRGLMQLIRATVRRSRPDFDDTADETKDAVQTPEDGLSEAGRRRLDEASDDLGRRLAKDESDVFGQLDRYIDQKLNNAI